MRCFCTFSLEVQLIGVSAFVIVVCCGREIAGKSKKFMCLAGYEIRRGRYSQLKC